MQYYSISDIDMILKNFNEDNVKVTKNKGIYYYEIASSFDIEVSSFYVKDKKQATMYVWTFGIEDYIIIGRTWEDFNILYYKLVEHFSTSDECRLIIYVHNLSYEFQFIKNRFEWLKVFALKQREPVQAITNEGIEFRCSYLLSGYSLENLSSQLTKYKVDKNIASKVFQKPLSYLTKEHSQELEDLRKNIAELENDDKDIYEFLLKKYKNLKAEIGKINKGRFLETKFIVAK